MLEVVKGSVEDCLKKQSDANGSEPLKGSPPNGSKEKRRNTCKKLRTYCNSLLPISVITTSIKRYLEAFPMSHCEVRLGLSTFGTRKAQTTPFRFSLVPFRCWPESKFASSGTWSSLSKAPVLTVQLLVHHMTDLHASSMTLFFLSLLHSLPLSNLRFTVCLSWCFSFKLNKTVLFE